MGILQDILNLFSGKQFTTPEDEDLIVVGKNKSSINTSLVKVKDLKALVGSGGSRGSGSSGSDAWSFATAITDFQPIEGFSYIGNLPENTAVYKPFRIEGTVTLKNMGFLIQTLSTNLNMRLYGAVYKYDIATDTLNLQDYTGEMIVDTTSGVTGWNYVAFNGGYLTLDPGVYFSRVIAPSSVGQPVRIQTNFARNRMMGIVGTGTSTNAWYMFQQSTSYDFGATPSSISVSSLTKTVSAPTVTGKPFYTIIQP